VWDHWKTKRPHHWEHTCEQISETHHHWGVWVAAVGRKQPLQRELYERRWRLRRRRLVLSNTLWELLYSGVCGCGIIGDMHGEQKSEQSNHLEVGVAMVGVKQHTFETTALGCVWGGGGTNGGEQHRCTTIVLGFVLARRHEGWCGGDTIRGVQHRCVAIATIGCCWGRVVFPPDPSRRKRAHAENLA
jgi:hypothetical protein